MSLILTELKYPLGGDDADLRRLTARALGVDERALLRAEVLRRSVDARKKNDVHLLLRVRAECDPATEKRLLARDDSHIRPYAPARMETPVFGAEPLRGRIVVAGSGPAGLFCALLLAQYGYAPLVLERGKPVAERVADVERYWAGGALDTESNVMFGCGGAGTFSDGKLTARSVNDAYASFVLETFVQCGADGDILTDARPHIGTDRLRRLVPALVSRIEALGGEFRFSSRLSGIERHDGRLTAVRVACGGLETREAASALVLSTGQGARDVYRTLLESGVPMLPKPFAAGVRIEHPQAVIDATQYGPFAGHPALGSAEYHLTAKSGARGVYTFCMCPGGRVVASASGPEQTVVNGMSDRARDGLLANAAVVVQVGPEDYPPGALGGVAFAEKLERDAFFAAGGEGAAPAERAADFLAGGKPRAFGSVLPSYRPAAAPTDLRRCLPAFMAAGVADAITAFARQLKGFDLGDAVLTAVESRTSAPVRVLRNARLASPACAGLYPVGEGAGYAGGIVSSAVDGLKAALCIMGQYSCK